jgi:hypothetical protein
MNLLAWVYSLGIQLVLLPRFIANLAAPQARKIHHRPRLPGRILGVFKIGGFRRRAALQVNCRPF